MTFNIMFPYVYQLMVCYFRLLNLDLISRIYKQGGVAKKQPADCPLQPDLYSLCEQALGTEGMYEHSGQVARSRF